MADRKIERIKKKIRKLENYDKLEIRHWLNQWYFHMYEENRLTDGEE
tara:strand:- start:734 stop:874 length:141 start_codon:yes stop_codon:yes gene_type:complete